jgi:uncharacterized protein HemX
MIYAILAALVISAAAAVGGYVTGHQHGVESQAEVIQGWIEQAADLETKLDSQNRAVRSLEAKAKAASAAADRARQRADEATRDLAAKEQELLAAKPSIPDDPCASACRLLSRPL